MVIVQVIVKSHGQHTYLQETMKSSKPEFYASTSLSSQVICCKHYISMYLDEYLAKLSFCEKNLVTKIPPTPKPYGSGINMQYFPNNFNFSVI